MVKFSKWLFVLMIIVLTGLFSAHAQVNAVEYGKNRLQFKKFKWQYYQTKNFNTYFNQNGQEIAKYVAQVAEQELPSIETFTEYRLNRRLNIITYNEFADLKQSNIGLGTDWQNTGGLTKLVNNKLVIYFDGNHAHLLKQIREGIARVIVENQLFGEDIGEIASNQTLLDLPKWLTDGYIAYVAQNWSTELDDELKSEMLSDNYKNFYQFVFDKPFVAGHAFWYYMQEKYKKENTTYFLYLARTYKNLNKASLQVCKQKFKYVLADFMEYENDKYENDVSRRKAYPKGKNIESFDINKNLDYYRINVNPSKNSHTYAFVKYKKGIVRLVLSEDDELTTLLKYGVLSYQNATNPTYPLMAWDPKGTRLTVIYNEQGRLKLFTFDCLRRYKQYNIDLTDKFDQIQNVTYMTNSSNTLILSAVKNGHSDIFTFTLDKEKVVQVTNDVYDDLDASFVAFPNKTGIIFSSNRPTANAKTGDTVIPSKNRFNIFLVTDFGGKAEFNQITQLSNLKYGDARLPMQYNESHFTFISDQNGVGNRYAGFFNTKKAGLDTLVIIGDNILHNPSVKEVDSTLRVNKKTDVDSVAVIAISEDSAYTFPLSNYPSTVAETRIAGENNQVSEVTRQSDEKILYKLKIDDNTLRKRNVSTPPTSYMKQIIMKDDIEKGDTLNNKTADSFKVFNSDNNIVQTNFLQTAKLYKYKPVKFSIDFGGVGFNNAILVNKYQPYGGGGGPISLTSNTPLNGLIKVGTSELMEDVKITGAYKLSTNLKDNEWLLSYQNYKRRLDWGLTFYRNVLDTYDDNGALFGRMFTNLYQANVSYPIDETKSIRLTTGIRSDNLVVLSQEISSLNASNVHRMFETSDLQYVYDNTLNPAQNIWNGIRYKFYIDWNTDISKEKVSTGKYNFNWGFDARYYYPIYRNFIWAGRAAGDFSWGGQKTIYYMGGMDGWLMFGSNQKPDGTDRYFNTNNPPASDQTYTYQTLSQNLRGFIQNIANGNNAVILNSEFRLPVFTTFLNRIITNSFLQNFQITQFVDLGTAWNGSYGGIKRPSITYTDGGPVSVTVKAGGVGPFAGGYGFGARSTILGYFLKFDAGWQMNGFFKGKPILYLSMGLDF